MDVVMVEGDQPSNPGVTYGKTLETFPRKINVSMQGTTVD